VVNELVSLNPIAIPTPVTETARFAGSELACSMQRRV
jgi:hypothetical protein